MSSENNLHCHILFIHGVIGELSCEWGWPTPPIPSKSVPLRKPWFYLEKALTGKRGSASASTSASRNQWQLLADSCSYCRKGRFYGKALLQAPSVSQTSPHTAPRMDANATTASREYSRDYVVCGRLPDQCGSTHITTTVAPSLCPRRSLRENWFL